MVLPNFSGFGELQTASLRQHLYDIDLHLFSPQPRSGVASVEVLRDFSGFGELQTASLRQHLYDIDLHLFSPQPRSGVASVEVLRDFSGFGELQTTSLRQHLYDIDLHLFSPQPHSGVASVEPEFIPVVQDVMLCPQAPSGRSLRIGKVVYSSETSHSLGLCQVNHSSVK